MATHTLVTSNPLTLNDSLQNYLLSPTFLPNNVWKTTFSPCSQYLAIPKQDIYGGDCIVIIHCQDWHTNEKVDQFYIYERFACSSAVWSLAFGQRILKLDFSERQRSTSSVNRRFDFTRNLFLAAGLADGKINIWNVESKELTLTLNDHQSTVCGLAFTSCSMQLASCSHDTTIKLWDLLDDGKFFGRKESWLKYSRLGNMYKTLKNWTHVINTVKWSPNGKLLCAVGPHQLVTLYNTKTWTEMFNFDGHLHNVVDCAFSSDSALLATASFDTHILLWSTVTGELLKEFLHIIPKPMKIYAGGENGSFVRSVIFTKFDQHIISTCDDNFVRWFPVKSAYRTGSIHRQTQNNVLCVSTTTDGKTMAVGTRTGQVHLWSMSATCQLPSLKSFCRILINHQYSNIINLPISQYLISYLLYKDIQVK
ncbi:unnamed protein product [Adineta ricciae]|uniref:Uncharacterized protein n=1 Tax=Adineta ricciae TaxID=249248 RepID=A0A813YP06_ADIRI|nr:unnamed protein product [Adineta ricciae]